MKSGPRAAVGPGPAYESGLEAALAGQGGGLAEPGGEAGFVEGFGLGEVQVAGALVLPSRFWPQETMPRTVKSRHSD